MLTNDAQLFAFMLDYMPSRARLCSFMLNDVRQFNASWPCSSAVNEEFSDYDPVHEEQELETILGKSAPVGQLRSAAPARTSQTSQTSPLPAPQRTPLKDSSKSAKQEDSPSIEHQALASQVSTDVGLRLMQRTDKAIIIASVVPGSIAAQQGSIQVHLRACWLEKAAPAVTAARPLLTRH